MRIAFLNRYQNINKRGVEVFIAELSKRLSQKYTVDIFSDNADSLSKVLKGNYDVVIPTNGRGQAVKISLGRFLGKYKVLITGHSGKGWDDILNIIVRPDVFITLTDYLADWAKNWAWGTKIVKIPNGVDLKRFKPIGEKMKIDLPKPVILSVGALVWYKNHDKAIKAVSRLEKGSLLIVGEGPLEKDLRDEGRNLLGDRFKIMNFKNEEMPEVYRSCDLFTLPSWDREAFGIVYLEAMASGLGVVAPRDKTREEIVGQVGILTDVNNIEGYAQDLKKALNIDWHKLAREQAEKFSWDKVAKQYEEILENLK